MRGSVARGIGLLVAAGLASLALAGPAAALNKSSSFDTGAEGWTYTEGGVVDLPVNFLTEAENGFISVTENDSGNSYDTLFVAPPSWSGDALVNYGGTLSFKIRSDDPAPFPPAALLTNAADPASPQTGDIYLIRDGSALGSSFGLNSFPLNPGGWITDYELQTPATEGEFRAVLHDLTAVMIFADNSTSPTETTDLDDVSFGGGSLPVTTATRQIKPFLGDSSVGRLSGMIASSEPSCRKRQRLTIFRKTRRGTSKVGTTTSKADASFAFEPAKRQAHGSFYAKLAKSRAGSELFPVDCAATTSRTVKLS